MRCIPLMVLAIAVCACPRKGGGTRPDEHEVERPLFTPQKDPTADEALEQATQVADTQPRAKAVEAYLSVRKAYPQSTAAQEALFRAGVLYFESGEYASARKAFNELLYENPLFDKALRAKLLSGLAALEVHAYRDAYQTLSTLADKLSGEERRQAEDGIARAAQGAQLHGEALRLAIRRIDEAQDPTQKEAALQSLEELIEGRVGFLDVARGRAELSFTHPAWPILTFKLARIHYHLRDWAKLEETLKEYLREAPNHAYAEQARELLARAHRRSEVRPKVVGVVLPLSGKYKQLGEAVMRGIELALRGSDVELVVKDSQGDVNLAGKLVEELAFDDGAIAVIGPLLNDDSRRAAVVAEELEIPILTLTRSEDITAIGPHVFRNMLTSSQQAKALAEFATESLGYRNFALLYPNIPFAEELTNQFWDEVVARGGAIRGAESYDHDQTTYSSPVKKLVGRAYPEERADYREALQRIAASNLDSFRKRKAREKALSQLDPIVDFEALLIPDTWQRVGLVTPALAVEDIITNACDPRDLEKIRKTTGKKHLKTVTLLGTNTWSSPKGRSGLPELLERGGKFVTCSVYVDGFFADSQRPATKRFVAAFNQTHKDAQPTLLDAIGYDSAGMVRQVMERARPQTRADLQLGLASLRDFDGATGKTHFNERREAVKPLFYLTIESSGVRELTPKPKPSGS